MKPAYTLIVTALMILAIDSAYAQHKPPSPTTAAPPPATKSAPSSASKTRAPAATTKSHVPCPRQSSINHDERLIVPETEAAWNQARMRSRQKPKVSKQPPCTQQTDGVSP